MRGLSRVWLLLKSTMLEVLWAWILQTDVLLMSPVLEPNDLPHWEQLPRRCLTAVFFPSQSYRPLWNPLQPELPSFKHVFSIEIDNPLVQWILWLLQIREMCHFKWFPRVPFSVLNFWPVMKAACCSHNHRQAARHQAKEHFGKSLSKGDDEISFPSKIKTDSSYLEINFPGKQGSRCGGFWQLTC